MEILVILVSLWVCLLLGMMILSLPIMLINMITPIPKKIFEYYFYVYKILLFQDPTKDKKKL